MSPSSVTEVKEIYEKFTMMKGQVSTRKLNALDINECIEVVDKV